MSAEKEDYADADIESFESATSQDESQQSVRIGPLPSSFQIGKSKSSFDSNSFKSTF